MPWTLLSPLSEESLAKTFYSAGTPGEGSWLTARRSGLFFLRFLKKDFYSAGTPGEDSRLTPRRYGLFFLRFLEESLARTFLFRGDARRGLMAHSPAPGCSVTLGGNGGHPICCLPKRWKCKCCTLCIPSFPQLFTMRNRSASPAPRPALQRPQKCEPLPHCFPGDLQRRRNVLLGNEQHMYGGLRIQVVKGHHLAVLIYFIRRISP